MMKRELLRLKRDENGAAMVLVLCLMVLFITLAFTIMLSANVLVGEARKDETQKQCQILATSFSKRVEAAMNNRDLTSGADGEKIIDTNHLPGFLRSMIDANANPDATWDYYYEDSIAHSDRESCTHRYGLALSDELAREGYSLYMEIYWTVDSQQDFLEGTDLNRYNEAEAVITVVCENEQKNQSYKIRTNYQCSITYEGTYDPNHPPGADQWAQSSWSWNKL